MIEETFIPLLSSLVRHPSINTCSPSGSGIFTLLF